MKKYHLPIFLFVLLFLFGFTFSFLSRGNMEFLIYVGVIIFFLIVIFISDKKVHFSQLVLWGLAIWAVLHMSGGGLEIGEGRLYELMLLPLSENYPIIRYDQFVHFFGFTVTTVLCYELIEPILKINHKGWIALSVILVMAGSGFGALNEIVEFIATLITPETGVGGYVNTSLDLVSNFLGAIFGLLIIYRRRKRT